MKNRTVKIVAASAVVLMGVAGASTLALADKDRMGWSGSQGGQHDMKKRGGKHQGKRGGKQVERMFEQFDTNGDGKLTQDEINAARTDMLAKHDADGDGKLSLAEFEAVWEEMTKQRMVRAFQRIDADGDASITVEEFLKPYANIVERMDRNGDGEISKDDRQRRKRRSGQKGQQGQQGKNAN